MDQQSLPSIPTHLKLLTVYRDERPSSKLSYVILAEDQNYVTQFYWDGVSSHYWYSESFMKERLIASPKDSLT